jgi:hypothetical protein
VKWEKAMKKLRKHLAELAEQQALVRVDRKPMDPFRLDGFVLAVSKKFLLLQLVDGHTMTLNGYSVVRLADIREVQIESTFVPRALAQLERQPTPLPNLNLADWPSLLASAGHLYPLLTLEREKKRPGCCYIGQIERLTRNNAYLRTVDTQARWDDIEKFKLADLTQVEFDDGYSAALLAVLEPAAKTGRE